MTEQTKAKLREALESLLNTENVVALSIAYYDDAKRLYCDTTTKVNDIETRQETKTTLKDEDEN